MHSQMKSRSKEIYLLFHNIRSTHNVGSMFRTADAAGVSKIFLSGYTPTPVDRFGREVKELSKTALGGELSVAWEYCEDPVEIIKKLQQEIKDQNIFENKSGKNKKQKLQIISIEQDKKSQDYKKIKIKFPALFIVGNEIEGISSEILKLSDVIAEIPMKGKKESLNVGVSLGIALFRMLNI